MIKNIEGDVVEARIVLDDMTVEDARDVLAKLKKFLDENV